jgi:hypothetical protein
MGALGIVETPVFSWILVLIQPVRCGLPYVEHGTGDRLAAVEVIHLAVDPNPVTSGIGADDGLASLTEGGIRPVERTDERKPDGRLRPIVADDFDELADAKHVSQEQELIALVTSELCHSFHKGPGILPFLLRRSHLLHAPVQVTNQARQNLPEAAFLDSGICFDRFVREPVAPISRRHAFPIFARKSFFRSDGPLVYQPHFANSRPNSVHLDLFSLHAGCVRSGRIRLAG